MLDDFRRWISGHDCLLRSLQSNGRCRTNRLRYVHISIVRIVLVSNSINLEHHMQIIITTDVVQRTFDNEGLQMQLPKVPVFHILCCRVD